MLLPVVAFALSSSRALAHVQVIDMVPRAQSAEHVQDSEPSLTVDFTTTPCAMAASAFTSDNLDSVTMNGSRAPIYASLDCGSTWGLVNLLPSAPGGFPTNDVTLMFDQTAIPGGHTLYIAMLNSPDANVQLYRTDAFTDSGVTPTLIDNRSKYVPGDTTHTNYVDQPRVSVQTIHNGADRRDVVAVGFNNGYSINPRSSTADVSQNALLADPAFSLYALESRESTDDGAANPVIIANDGTVYCAYFANRPDGLVDLVVVRDDNFAGSGPAPFSALVDVDGKSGKIVAPQIATPGGGQYIGQNRLSESDISIAVDPRNSSRIYLAWGESSTDGKSQELHLRRSVDRGEHWSASDILTIPDAINPAIAISGAGKVGYLYQRLFEGKWETHITLSIDPDALTFDGSGGGVVLARHDASHPVMQFDPYLGDYLSLLCKNDKFYGIFSASNYPDMADFPSGVTYQRFADWTRHLLFASDPRTPGATIVSPSIDPFFFSVDP